MTADMEIIGVGNELLIGKIANTNAQWMCRRATALGVTVKRITVVSDDLAEIAQVIREVLNRKPAFLITTGGLGPTFDDMTLQGIAKGLDVEFTVDDEALRMVTEKYVEYAKLRGTEVGEMSPARVKMAKFPKGAKPLPNPVGSAPGMYIEVDDTVLVALPGVPSEMYAIFDASVVPLLREAAGDVGFYEKSLYIDRIMESTLAPLIDKAMHDTPLVYIKSHPKREEDKPGMELHFSTSGKPQEKPEARLEKAAAQLAGLVEASGGRVCTVKQTST